MSYGRPRRRSRPMRGAPICPRTRARSPTGPTPGSAAIAPRPNIRTEGAWGILALRLEGEDPQGGPLHRVYCVLRDAPSALLRMRYFVDGIKKVPHPEEPAKQA